MDMSLHLTRPESRFERLIRFLGPVQQVLSGDWTSRPDESDYIWVDKRQKKLINTLNFLFTDDGFTKRGVPHTGNVAAVEDIIKCEHFTKLAFVESDFEAILPKNNTDAKMKTEPHFLLSNVGGKFYVNYNPEGNKYEVGDSSNEKVVPDPGGTAKDPTNGVEMETDDKDDFEQVSSPNSSKKKKKSTSQPKPESESLKRKTEVESPRQKVEADSTQQITEAKSPDQSPSKSSKKKSKKNKNEDKSELSEDHEKPSSSVDLHAEEKRNDISLSAAALPVEEMMITEEDDDGEFQVNSKKSKKKTAAKPSTEQSADSRTKVSQTPEKNKASAALDKSDVVSTEPKKSQNVSTKPNKSEKELKEANKSVKVSTDPKKSEKVLTEPSSSEKPTGDEKMEEDGQTSSRCSVDQGSSLDGSETKKKKKKNADDLSMRIPKLLTFLFTKNGLEAKNLSRSEDGFVSLDDIWKAYQEQYSDKDEFCNAIRNNKEYEHKEGKGHFWIKELKQKGPSVNTDKFADSSDVRRNQNDNASGVSSKPGQEKNADDLPKRIPKLLRFLFTRNGLEEKNLLRNEDGFVSVDDIWKAYQDQYSDKEEFCKAIRSNKEYEHKEGEGQFWIKEFEQKHTVKFADSSDVSRNQNDNASGSSNKPGQEKNYEKLRGTLFWLLAKDGARKENISFQPGKYLLVEDILKASSLRYYSSDDVINACARDPRKSFVVEKLRDEWAVKLNDSRPKQFTSQTSAHHDITLSKNLSYLLRHSNDPDIMSDGFIFIDDLLRKRNFSNYSEEDVKRVVRDNDKQRFLIEDDGGRLKVRANQGHTIEVPDLELTPVNGSMDAPVVVHGTYFKSWTAIQEKGLSRMGRQHIHFAAGEPGQDGVISGMRGTCEILIYVDIDRAIAAGIPFVRSANNVILSAGNKDGVIPKEFFKTVVQRNNRKPLV